MNASEARATSPFDDVLRQAGAVFVRRDGRAVAANYGSAAGELAACVRGAGLADCSELTKLELAGPPRALAAFAARLIGAEIAPGGALFAGGVWWCGVGASACDDTSWAHRHADLERLIAVCEPSAGRRLQSRLLAFAEQRPNLTLRDRSRDWAALALVGRRAGELLAKLGVYGPSGDPRQTAPFGAHPVGGVPARWLLQSDRRAVVLVDREQADLAWRAIEREGRALGVCCVGKDALARHALIERRSQLNALG